MLAKQLNYPPETLIYLQESVLKQYAYDYGNVPGLINLIQRCKLPRVEVERILTKDYVDQFLKSAW